MPRLRVPVAVPRTKGLVAVPRPELASGDLLSIASTPAYIVNLPEDEGRRKATRREVNALQPLQCVVPRGVCGANLVRRAEREKVGTCRLHLTRDASATSGVTSVSAGGGPSPLAKRAFASAQLTGGRAPASLVVGRDHERRLEAEPARDVLCSIPEVAAPGLAPPRHDPAEWSDERSW